MKRTILVADDEPKIVEVLSLYLKNAGYDVIPVFSGEDVLKIVREAFPSLIVLDLMLPGISGEEVCSNIRTFSSVPILMLTAKHSDKDRLTGLQIGADDYVTKPFNPNEVVARVGAILRRTSDDHLFASRVVYYGGDLVIDDDQRIAYKNGENTELTGTEFSLLITLARQPKRVFSREELIDRVFGINFRGDTRTIDAHVKNLRAKIESDPRRPVYVQTVYGIGYRFDGGDL